MSRTAHPESRRLYQVLGKSRVGAEAPWEAHEPVREGPVRATRDYERRLELFYAGRIDDDRVTCGSCGRARAFRNGEGYGCGVGGRPVDLTQPHRCERWFKK